MLHSFNASTIEPMSYKFHIIDLKATMINVSTHDVN